MKKFLMLFFICIVFFVPERAFSACMCTIEFSAWAKGPWNVFAKQFVATGGQKLPTSGTIPGVPGTMDYHRNVLFGGLTAIFNSLSSASSGEMHVKQDVGKLSARSLLESKYQADNVDRKLKQQMKMTEQTVREQTLLQDDSARPAADMGNGCVDQQSELAMYASGGLSSLVRQRQKGREAMRHETGQATDVIKKRKDAAAAYQKAMNEANVESPSATPSKGMMVFPTQDLYEQTSNIVKKLVELDKPFEDVKKLNLDTDHAREYIALRDARKLISELRGDAVETGIDWHAPIFPKEIIQLIFNTFNNEADLSQYVNRDGKASLASENSAFAKLQLSQAMAEHINSDNASSEIAFLLSHMIVLQERRTKMMQMLAALLASETVMPRIDEYLNNLRSNEGENL